MKDKTMAQKEATAGKHQFSLVLPVQIFTHLKRLAQKKGVSVSSLIKDSISVCYGGEK